MTDNNLDRQYIREVRLYNQAFERKHKDEIIELNQPHKTKDNKREKRKFDQKAYEKAYRLKNKEKIKAYKKAYYQANKEERDAYERAYKLRNKEKIRASRKAYYQANKERKKAYARAYRLKKKAEENKNGKPKNNL